MDTVGQYWLYIQPLYQFWRAFATFYQLDIHLHCKWQKLMGLKFGRLDKLIFTKSLSFLNQYLTTTQRYHQKWMKCRSCQILKLKCTIDCSNKGTPKIHISWNWLVHLIYQFIYQTFVCYGSYLIHSCMYDHTVLPYVYAVPISITVHNSTSVVCQNYYPCVHSFSWIDIVQLHNSFMQ